MTQPGLLNCCHMMKLIIKFSKPGSCVDMHRTYIGNALLWMFASVHTTFWNMTVHTHTLKVFSPFSRHASTAPGSSWFVSHRALKQKVTQTASNAWIHQGDPRAGKANPNTENVTIHALTPAGESTLYPGTSRKVVN